MVSLEVPTTVEIGPVPLSGPISLVARSRMNRDCAYQLTSFEPIVGVLMRLERDRDGWTLWVRHRHYGGLFGDCEPWEYTLLSDAELLDAISAEHGGWVARTVPTEGPFRHPGG